MLTLHETPVHTGTEDRVGYLVCMDGELVAVLVRLDAPEHEQTQVRGKWFLEAGFGPFRDLECVFNTPAEALGRLTTLAAACSGTD